MKHRGRKKNMAFPLMKVSLFLETVYLSVFQTRKSLGQFIFSFLGTKYFT